MRTPHTEKKPVKRVAWSPMEDWKLIACLSSTSNLSWNEIPKVAGLERTGKSCRLRWVNYLKPGIKCGDFTNEEDETILKMYAKMGSRWSAMAAELPGRTDNAIKNYWHAHLKKRMMNSSVPTTESQEIQSSLVEATQKDPSDSGVSLASPPKASELEDSVGMLVSPELSNANISSTSPNPVVEVYKNQTIDEHICSPGKSQEFQSDEGHLFSMQNFHVEGGWPTYADPTFLHHQAMCPLDSSDDI